MSDCCLPNLGCLAIPIKSTEITGPIGLPGNNGVGITSALYNNANGTLTIFYTDNTSQNVGVVQGAPGGVGQDGIPGLARLYSNFVSSSSALPAFGTYTVDTYSVPANTFLSDGDALVINLRTSRASSTGSCQRKISWNGVSISRPILSEVEMFTASLTYQYNTRIEIVRTSANTAVCNVVSDYDIKSNNANGIQTYTFQKTISAVNFGIINIINVDLTQALANQAVFKSLTIDKITAL